MDYQLLLHEQVLGNHSSAATGSKQPGQGGEQVKMLDEAGGLTDDVGKSKTDDYRNQYRKLLEE